MGRTCWISQRTWMLRTWQRVLSHWGAKLDEDEQDPALEAISEQREPLRSVNGGVDYVTDDNAVKEYGKIYKTVTWDDVTVPENLKKRPRNI